MVAWAAPLSLCPSWQHCVGSPWDPLGQEGKAPSHSEGRQVLELE